MSKGLSIKQKAKLLRQYLGERESFTLSDMEDILQEKKSTLNWTVWSLHKDGYTSRLGKGLYTFNRLQDKKQLKPRLTDLAQKAYNILIESGYDFFVTGLDVLSIFMLHVPERYPALVFVDKYSLFDVLDYLRANDINAIDYSKVRHFPGINDLVLIGDIVLLSITREFSYAENGIASFEKAFVDLYYEVTRKKYPLPMQELVRIYSNMKRRIILDEKRLVKIASQRSLQRDIRFITESKYINSQAFEFVELLKSTS
ncbi:MAG: DUF6577 family protein [Candidatus Zixiibacteriota bacterium]